MANGRTSAASAAADRFLASLDAEEEAARERYERRQRSHAAAPHLLVSGATGYGKSTLLRGLVASLPLGWAWRVLVIDPKRVEFERFRHELEVVGLDGLVGMSQRLEKEVAYRRERLRAEGIDHWLDLAPRVVPVRPALLVVDEAVDVLAGSGLPRADAAAVRETLGVVLRQGRATGVHVVAAFTRPDTDVIPGALRYQFAARVGLGPLSPDSHRMLFGTTPDGADRLAMPGMGAALGLDGTTTVRRFRCAPATVEDVRARFRA